MVMVMAVTTIAQRIGAARSWPRSRNVWLLFSSNSRRRRRRLPLVAQAKQQATTASALSFRNPLARVDISKLEQLTLSDDSMALITKLLQDLDVVVVNNDDDDDSSSTTDAPRETLKQKQQQQQENNNNNHKEATSTTSSQERDDFVDTTTTPTGASITATLTNTGYEEYEEDGDDEYLAETTTTTAGTTAAVVVESLSQDSEETAWDGSDNEDEAQDWMSIRNDPVFVHLTQRLSFSSRDAARACRAVEHWSAAAATEASHKATITSSSSHTTTTTPKLKNVMDWLCLHLSEPDLQAGFVAQTEAITSPAGTTTKTTSRRRRITSKPIPHPSISVATRLTDDVEWRRTTRLEERAVGFLCFGFGHSEIWTALEAEEQPEKMEEDETRRLAAAVDDSAVLRRLLVGLEQEVVLLANDETKKSNDESSSHADQAAGNNDDDIQLERKMEQEALTAIYEAGFQIAETSTAGLDRYKISMEMQGISEVTDLHVFLRPGYPTREAPHCFWLPIHRCRGRFSDKSMPRLCAR